MAPTGHFDPALFRHARESGHPGKEPCLRHLGPRLRGGDDGEQTAVIGLGLSSSLAPFGTVLSGDRQSQFPCQLIALIRLANDVEIIRQPVLEAESGRRVSGSQEHL